MRIYLPQKRAPQKTHLPETIHGWSIPHPESRLLTGKGHSGNKEGIIYAAFNIPKFLHRDSKRTSSGHRHVLRSLVRKMRHDEAYLRRDRTKILQTDTVLRSRNRRIPSSRRWLWGRYRPNICLFPKWKIPRQYAGNHRPGRIWTPPTKNL